MSQANHSDSDCLIIAVLSHGDRGKIYAKDNAYPVDTLWNQFTGDKCITLAGKPKIFFIQVSRKSHYHFTKQYLNFNFRLVEVMKLMMVFKLGHQYKPIVKFRFIQFLQWQTS